MVKATGDPATGSGWARPRRAAGSGAGVGRAGRQPVAAVFRAWGRGRDEYGGAGSRPAAAGGQIIFT